MRNISYSLTTPQFKARSKDVTRRMGWEHLKVGEKLMGCEKCMGRKKGEPLVRLGAVEVVSVRREPLMRMTQDLAYGREECRREGFPEMTPHQFVEFFCSSHAGCTPASLVTRIEFRYLDTMAEEPLFANPEAQAEYDTATPARKRWMMRQRNEASFSEREPAEMARLLDKND